MSLRESALGPAGMILAAGDEIAAAAQKITDPLERASALELASANVVTLQQRIRDIRAQAIREAMSASSATAVANDLDMSRTRLYKILGPDGHNRGPRAQSAEEVDALLEPLLVSGATDDDVRRAIVLVAYAGLRLPETAKLSWDDVDLFEKADPGAAGVARVRNRGGLSEVTLSQFVVNHLLPQASGFVITGGGHNPPDPLTLANRVGGVTRGAGVKTIQAMRRAFLERARRDAGT